MAVSKEHDDTATFSFPDELELDMTGGEMLPGARRVGGQDLPDVGRRGR